MLRRIEGRKRRVQRMRWLYSITDSMVRNLSIFQEIVDRGSWNAAVHGRAKNWT